MSNNVSTSPLNNLQNAAVNEQIQALLISAKKSIEGLTKVNTTDSVKLQADYSTFINTTQSVSNRPAGISPGDYLTMTREAISALDSRRDDIIGSYVSSSTDFFGAIFSQFKYYCMMVTYILGPLFGFIIMTNIFFDENILIKLFYGLFGALWYPLIVVYGLFVPPVWRALIIPLVRSDIPVGFFEFWKYNVTIDIDSTAKKQTMMRLYCIGFIALFAYSFFF